MRRIWRESRGFLIGLLAVAVPVGAFLLLRPSPDSGERIETAAPAPVRPAAAPPAPAPPIQIDRTGLREAGAALPGPTPLPDPDMVLRALSRAEGWLRAHEIDPFGGGGVDSLRLFALEVQCWDRLWRAERDPERGAALEEEVRRRLRRVLDPDRLAGRLRVAEGAAGWLELLVLASLSADHGVETGAIAPLLAEAARGLSAAAGRMPPSMRAIVASLLGRPEERPPYGPYRLVAMGVAEADALSQRILAETDLARRFHDPIDPEQLRNLRETLPHLALSNALLRNRELFADLLSCLALVGLTDTYGYREGMRILLEQQDGDGSFGDPAGSRAVRLAPTAGALTALTLERIRAERGS